MATIPRVLLSEYLHEVYRPDCDYVDGELEERNVGEKEHSAWQFALARFFHQRRKEWGIRIYPELRLQVAPTRYRVPDVMLLRGDAPDEQIITHPPLVCIEILSPEDRFGRMGERIADYLSMGVGHVWIVEPTTDGGKSAAQGYHCKGANHREWRAVDRLTVEGTGIGVDLAGIAADLD
jgi:Uma2 family endonuclease